jgi:hypothetical protein
MPKKGSLDAQYWQVLMVNDGNTVVYCPLDFEKLKPFLRKQGITWDHTKTHCGECKRKLAKPIVFRCT